MSKKVVIVEPFYTGSHRKWTDGLVRLYSKSGHEVTKLTLPGRHWKWRMFGAANFLAEEFLKLNIKPDVLIASDMLDLPVFVGVSRKNLLKAKLVLYFHENQLTYPWSPTDVDVELKRDQSYGYINLRSALCADEVYFNSKYHQGSFLNALDKFIRQFPDASKLEWKEQIHNKAKVLYLGMDLEPIFHLGEKQNTIPVLLWNHRWEYDKNPELFYEGIQRLKNDEIDFRLIVCGERTNKYPKIFDQIRKEFEHELIHFGYAENLRDYYDLLSQATILPVTCNQDFFGGSVVEAIAAGCIPVLPDRLAYSEHLPESLKDIYVAANDEDWYQLLKDAILNLRRHQKALHKLTEHISRYDWNQLGADYLKMLK
ncbi:MAG: DUF3524 domain-containing protein [Flavobacteriales bacterium]|nr:DUF3524 domain-containing protein [Flavobacteriales bacterium]